MKDIKKKVIKAAAILNLAVLLLFNFSLLRFYHPHQLPDGTVIWHSHPYSATHGCLPSHQHHGTNSSIADNLFSGHSDLVIHYSRAIITTYGIHQYLILVERLTTRFANLLVTLRGPPTLN